MKIGDTVKTPNPNIFGKIEYFLRPLSIPDRATILTKTKTNYTHVGIKSSDGFLYVNKINEIEVIS